LNVILNSPKLTKTTVCSKLVPLREKEYLFKNDPVHHRIDGVVDELTADGCKFVSYLTLEKSLMVIHVHGQNDHFFHTVHPKINIQMYLRENPTSPISFTFPLCDLYPKALRYLTKRETDILTDLTKFGICADNVQRIKVCHLA
jgi:hypothetical protein